MPIQVFFGGISQLKNPQNVPKSAKFQVAPRTPDFAFGLEEIQAEASTRDGLVLDALGRPGSPPNIIGGDESLVRGADGLVCATRHA